MKDLHTDNIKERPEEIKGVTTKVETGCGKAYVITNFDDEGEVFELFCHHGMSGECAHTIMQGLTMIISIALRSGSHPKDIINHLEGNKCSKASISTKSCPEAIAEGMKIAIHEYNKKGEE